MQKIWQAFKGKKTYLMVIISVLMMFCQLMGWHVFSAEAWGMVGITGATTLRMGMK